MHVMRTFLADGKIDFQGDFFQYSGSSRRPVPSRRSCRCSWAR
jgi:hypothetical protein